jgi:gamma-glutamyl hercynylcysteine S-oxide synthase
VLEGARLDDDRDPLHFGGFVWDMLIQHEHQHNETMLQALALAEPGTIPVGPASEGPPAAVAEASVVVEGGPFPLGAGEGTFSYDNERPQHLVDVPSFRIDRLPVTNGAYAEFVDDRGYGRPELWSAEGWAWRAREAVERPLYWTPDGGERDFDQVSARDPARPVMHLSWFEADAFARWAGKRLPTEAEWEKAATWEPATGVKRRFPWGEQPPDGERANLGGHSFGPAPAGAYPAGASAAGVLGLIGNAWEWCSTDFTPYPDFEAFPYREYSEVFFGSRYKVLRGGSWATGAPAIRGTFRNWDLPQRRQIFTGFRCASDG